MRTGASQAGGGGTILRRMPPLAMRDRARRLATLLLLAGFATSSSHAQGRRVVDNQHSWYAYFGEHAMAGRWSLWLDLHLRREGLGATWQQLLVRPGLTYRLGEHARLGAGYGYIVTHQYGDDPIPARFPEHRAWQQLALTHDAGRVQFAQRYRLEQRWLGTMDTTARADGGGDRVTDWQRRSRLRYQLRATLPLRAGGAAKAAGPTGGPTDAATGPYLTAFDELFIAVGRSGRVSVFDQNRAFVGVGWRWSARWRAEAGYMQQLVMRADGRSVEDNGTLTVSLFSAVPVGR